VGDASITEDQAHIEVELKNGEKHSRFVEASLGNIHRPLTDAQLDAKFRDQAVLALPSAQAETVLQQCWKIDQFENVNTLIQMTIPR
jgi:2-methylcitrate dehydratase PrpD